MIHFDTLIHFAAASGNLDVLKCLHKKELSLLDVDRKGNTAFMSASENGHIDIVEYLLQNLESMNLNESNSFGFNALDVSLINGYQNIARLLTKELAKSKIPQLIFNLKKDFNSISCRNYLLHPLNIKMSEELKNQIFLIRGKDNGRPAFHYVDVYPWEMQKLRNQTKGTNIDVTDYGKIFRSGWGENPSKETVYEIQLLEEERTFFDKFKNAIFKNNIHMIIQSGLDKYKEYYGASLLHISAAYGRIDVIIWLFLNKYDIKTTDDCGNTALYYAALNDQYEVIILLKLFGLNELFIGECRFFSGHMQQYSLKYDSADFHENILVASLINGIKAINKFQIPEILKRAQTIFKDYFSGNETEEDIRLLTQRINNYRDKLSTADYFFQY